MVKLDYLDLRSHGSQSIDSCLKLPAIDLTDLQGCCKIALLGVCNLRQNINKFSPKSLYILGMEEWNGMEWTGMDGPYFMEQL